MRSLPDHLSSFFGGKPRARTTRGTASPSLNHESPENASQFRESYVYVEDDGTARELEPDEIEYLRAEFEGGDGAAPYIKDSYEQRTPDKRLRGYLLRKQLPAGVRVKTLAELPPVESAEAAIEIAKMGIPMSHCIKCGTSLQRVMDPRTGKWAFGLPGVDVSSGKFSAKLMSGVWHVVRTPDASADAIETSCYADISAASGRIIRHSWLP